MSLATRADWTSGLNWKNFSVFLLVFFGALMIIMPMANHYFFRSFTYDYGAYNFALYDYAHFKVSSNPVYIVSDKTFLQDHLSFTFFFLAPFYWILKWIFGTYTLLVLQSAFIIWGGWASWKLILEKTESHFLGFLTLFLYFTLYGRYSSFATDCNLMIILSSFVPVFLLYFHRGKTWITILCFLFLILGRESIPLWTMFICLFLAIHYRTEREKVKLAAILGLASLVYFVFAFKVLIPAVENADRPFDLFNYSQLGASPMEALKFMLTHPFDTLELLFINTSGESYYDNVKSEFYFVYLLSGGILLFLRPYYLIPFIPLIAQKMFNDNPVRWGIASYYSIEIVAILPILIVLVLASLNWKKIALFLGCVACIMSFSITNYKLKPYNRELPWAGQGKINPRDRWFRISDLNIGLINKQLAKIPGNASVAASLNIVPHLAYREHIYYLYRIPIEVDYIVILKSDLPYLIDENEYADRIEGWKNDKKLNIQFENSDLIIFKKK